MKKAELYHAVLERLAAAIGNADTELTFGSPFQLLVAVVLSAQCTDRRVNLVTPSLFAAYPDAATMATATQEDVLAYIRSVSYPNSKAQHLVGLARMIESDYGGAVPDTLDALTRLPGVGRKTANVILATIFGQSAMAVDTHIFRVSHRLHLVPKSATTPLSVERYLTRYIPAEIVPKAHLWLLLHGRYTCTARRPHCAACLLSDLCRDKGRYDG